MNYSAMIQNRRSVHAFREKEVPSEAIGQLRSYYEKACPRLVPEIATELIVLDKDAQPALESSAGYKQDVYKRQATRRTRRRRWRPRSATRA